MDCIVCLLDIQRAELCGRSGVEPAVFKETCEHTPCSETWHHCIIVEIILDIRVWISCDNLFCRGDELFHLHIQCFIFVWHYDIVIIFCLGAVTVASITVLLWDFGAVYEFDFNGAALIDIYSIYRITQNLKVNILCWLLFAEIPYNQIIKGFRRI